MVDKQLGFYLNLETPLWIARDPSDDRIYQDYDAKLDYSTDVIQDVWTYDVSPGVALSAARAGLIFMNGEEEWDFRSDDGFEAAIRSRGEQIQVLNAFSYALHCSIRGAGWDLGALAISHSNLVFRSRETESFGGNEATMGRLEDHDGRRRSLPPVVRVIPQSLLDQAALFLEAVYSHAEPKALQLTALLNRSVAVYKDHDFPTALVMAWSVIESSQSMLWDEFSSDATRVNSMSLNSKLRKKVEKQDFTAGVVTELLERAGIFSPDDRTKIDQARDERNYWMHDTREPRRVVVSDAIATAHDIFCRTFAVGLPAPSISVGLRG